MPTDARNMPIERRAQAVVDFCELVVRGQMPDPDDPTSDYDVMAQCVAALVADLKYLASQAPAQWSTEFGAVLRSADSMRCVPIAPDRKDPRRQQPQRCDACGRYERWCGVALDLGGGDFRPEEWWDAARTLPGRWQDFRSRYNACLACTTTGRPQPGPCTSLRPHDLGRFCLGDTCLRKARLTYGASTFVSDMVYDAYAAVTEAFEPEYDEEENATEPLLWANEEEAAALLERKEQLELCIADERRQDTPDVMVNEQYWHLIDVARTEMGEDAVRERSRASLAGERFRPAPSGGPQGEADGGGGGERVVDEDEGEQGDEAAQSEAEDAEVLPPKKRKKSAKPSRRVVSDDEGDEEEFATARLATVARVRGARAAPARQSAKVPRVPRVPQRRSGRVAGLEPGEEVDMAQVAAAARARSSKANAVLGLQHMHNLDEIEESDEEEAAASSAAAAGGFSAVDDEPEVREVQEDSGEDEEEVGARGVGDGSRRELEDLVDVGCARVGSGRRAPAAVRAAAAMRMPQADGRAPPLGSRQTVLLEACALQQKLTAEGRDDDASVLDAVIMTYRELKAIAERSRGVGLGGR